MYEQLKALSELLGRMKEFKQFYKNVQFTILVLDVNQITSNAFSLNAFLLLFTNLFYVSLYSGLLHDV